MLIQNPPVCCPGLRDGFRHRPPGWARIDRYRNGGGYNLTGLTPLVQVGSAPMEIALLNQNGADKDGPAAAEVAAANARADRGWRYGRPAVS